MNKELRYKGTCKGCGNPELLTLKCQGTGAIIDDSARKKYPEVAADIERNGRDRFQITGHECGRTKGYGLGEIGTMRPVLSANLVGNKDKPEIEIRDSRTQRILFVYNSDGIPSGPLAFATT